MTQDVRSEPGGIAPGERLAGYLVQEQIGRGGMAVVYRAIDLRLGRPVALKVLAPHLGEDEAFRQRFIRESRASAGVDHPHIIPVFEAGEADGVLFIAMRYVSNGDVRRLIYDEGRLSAERTLRIAGQVAAALDAAHGCGLVHRDVKPGNILLAQAGDDSDYAYLSDFGLSKQSLAAATLTSTGQFLGTLDYVSPEQIQGQPVDGRADQYALACTVVEMLTGAPPFRHDDSMGLMWAQLEAEPPRLTERRPDLPAAVDRVIAAALAKSPAGRFATCREFAAALSMACTGAAASHQAGGSPAACSPEMLSGDGPEVPGVGYRAAVPVTSFDGVVTGKTGSPHRGVPAMRQPVTLPHRGPPFPPAPSMAPPAAPGRPGKATARPGRLAAWSALSSRRARIAGVAALVVVVVVAAAVIGLIVHNMPRHHAAAGPPPVSGSAGPGTGQQSPAGTVRAYFTDINQHRYLAAWRLVGSRDQFSTFRAGFAGTVHDSVMILSVSGNVVTARLEATQSDGSIRTYQGTYTVLNGVISSSNVQRVS